MLRLKNKHHMPETYEDGREGKISCQYRKQQCQLLIKESENSPRANRSALRCKNQTNKDWNRPWNPIINQRRMEEKGGDWFFTCEWEEKIHSEEGEAAALKHIYVVNGANPRAFSRLSAEGERRVSNDANRGAVTLGVTPSIAPARAQPPVPPLLTPSQAAGKPCSRSHRWRQTPCLLMYRMGQV
jgi:hypothetical protein